MATYLRGLTDVVPDIQPFSPDFGMIQKTLANRQQRFDAGFASLKNVYNQVLNAPLSDPANRAVRNAYIKDAQKQLADLSAKDLSIPQHQQEAEKVFSPFWEDDLILQDTGLTRWYQGELQKAYAARDSQDEKIRSQYNDVAVRYLQNGLEKLQQAGRDPNRYAKIEQRRFVPFQNLETHLNDQAQKAGLKIEWSSDRGPYLVSTVNGPKSVPAFETFAHNTLGNHFIEQFRVLGTVEREERQKILKKQFPLLNEEQSLALLASDYYNELEDGFAKRRRVLGTEGSHIQSRIADFEKLTILSPAQSQTYAELLQQADQYKDQQEKLKDEHAALTANKDKTLQTIVLNPDSFFASVMKQRTVNGWANARAAGQQVKIDINPVWKENNQVAYHKEQLDLDYKKLELDDKKYQLEKWKAEQEVNKSGKKKKGSGDEEPDPEAAGHFDGAGTTDVTQVGNAYQVFVERQQQRWGMAHEELFNISHGIGRVLSVLNIKDEDAVKYMDIMRDLSVDPENSKISKEDMAFFRSIGEKLRDYTGVDAAAGFQNARTGLLEAARKSLSQKLDKGSTGITSEDVEMLVSYTSATTALEEYNALEQERRELFTQKIEKDPKYAPYIVKRKDGSVDFVGKKEIANLFSKPSYKFTDGTVFTREQLAEFYLNGILTGGRPNDQQHITVDGKDYAQQPDQKATGPFHALRNEYATSLTKELAEVEKKFGTSKSFLEFRNKTNASIVPNLSEYQSQTGKLGFVVRYDLNTKTQHDVGARLINEAALPANQEGIYVEGKLSQDASLNRAILGLSTMGEGDLEKYISTSLLKTVGPTGRPSLVVKFKPMKETDRTTMEGFALADLAGKEIEFVLSATPTGETLRKIRLNPGYYIYGSLLRGKSIVSDPIFKAAGYSFEVTPNSRKEPRSAIVRMNRKVFKDGEYVDEPEYREEFSFADKNPDEIMGFLYSLFNQHLVNNLAAQKNYQLQKKAEQPTPAQIKAQYESSRK